MDSLKLIELNIGETDLDLKLGKEFLGIIFWFIKEECKWSSSKWKNFCSVKDTAKENAETDSYWEKIFTNHIFYKELLSRIL